MSKNTHRRFAPALKHTESVRLSHDRLTSRGGAGVGSSCAFRQLTSAKKGEGRRDLKKKQLLDTSSVDTPTLAF